MRLFILSPAEVFSEVSPPTIFRLGRLDPSANNRGMKDLLFKRFEIVFLLMVGALILASSQVAVANPAAKYDWPTGRVPLVLRGFENPPKPWMKGHRGVDLELSEGEDVRAAGDGQVCFAGKVAGKPLVSICHNQVLRTTYEPVEPRVKQGQWVSRGQVIGVLSSYPPPYPASPGLHWGAKTPTGYINPLSLLRGTVRLKPWDGVVH